MSSSPSDGVPTYVPIVMCALTALTVPGESVFFQGQQPFVYTVGPDSTVALAPVSLGTRRATRVEVLGGVEAGQTVVRTGHQKLFPGARVMPVDSETDADGAEATGP